jgi:hypothetical protein
MITRSSLNLLIASFLIESANSYPFFILIYFLSKSIENNYIIVYSFYASEIALSFMLVFLGDNILDLIYSIFLSIIAIIYYSEINIISYSLSIY